MATGFFRREGDWPSDDGCGNICSGGNFPKGGALARGQEHRVATGKEVLGIDFHYGMNGQIVFWLSADKVEDAVITRIAPGRYT